MQDLLHSARVGEAPGMRKLVLEHPGAMNIALQWRRRLSVQVQSLMRVAARRYGSPARVLDRLALLAGHGAPFLCAYRVDRRVESLGGAEGIDDARDARTMMRDRLGVDVPDVPAGPTDLSARVVARGLGREPIDGFSVFPGAQSLRAGSRSETLDPISSLSARIASTFFPGIMARSLTLCDGVCHQRGECAEVT